MKLFVQEFGSDAIQRFWVLEDDRNKIVSAMTQVESRSAICRLQNEGRMTPDEASLVFASIEAEMKRLIEQPLNSSVIEAAIGMIARRNLRTLDAVQLGSAIIARKLFGSEEVRFVASDKALLNAAEAEGFPTWNPQSLALP